jgi:hypothetical protein
MCKEMLVILVNKVGDPKRIIGKIEEERHKGSLTKKDLYLTFKIVIITSDPGITRILSSLLKSVQVDGETAEFAAVDTSFIISD